MPNFRRGPEAIQEAVDKARTGGGDFKPFLPSIFWKDGDTKYILVLNPIDDIPRVQLHNFLPLADGRFDQVIARTDESFGEKEDPIEQEWLYAPRLSNLMVAVELEPLISVVNGYERAKGFEVKTKVFERRVRDEDGELTDEREEVTIPVLGIISQSPMNFGSVLANIAAKDAPIHTTALRVERLGEDDPTYQITPYPDLELDLTNLFDFIEGINYIDKMDDLLEGIEGADTDEDATVLIGNTILEKRLDELVDDEHYEEVKANISKPSKYPSKAAKGKGEKSDSKRKPASRPARPTQRRGKTEESEVEATEPEAEAPEAPEAEAEEPKEKPARRSRARTREPEAEVTKESPVPEKLARLRKRTEEIQSAKA